MATPKIVTVTNPVDLLLAQLAEIRNGNAAKREEIQRAQRELKGGEKEEAKLDAELERMLAKHKQRQSAT